MCRRDQTAGSLWRLRSLSRTRWHTSFTMSWFSERGRHLRCGVASPHFLVGYWLAQCRSVRGRPTAMSARRSRTPSHSSAAASHEGFRIPIRATQGICRKLSEVDRSPVGSGHRREWEYTGGQNQEALVRRRKVPESPSGWHKAASFVCRRNGLCGGSCSSAKPFLVPLWAGPTNYADPGRCRRSMVRLKVPHQKGSSLPALD